MGMCAFAMPGVWTSKYKCCFINLQYNCSVAKNRVGSLPPTASRREAKLFSMPYQSPSDGFISCPSVLLLHLLYLPTRLLRPPHTPRLHLLRTACSPLGKLCSSMPLPLRLAMPFPAFVLRKALLVLGRTSSCGVPTVWAF